MASPQPPADFASSADETRSKIIRLTDVGRTFQMGEVRVKALRDVTLDVYEGEFLVLLGPSGSGKSTLLNILGGLDQPTEGEAWYRDQRLSDLSARELTRFRRDHIGFVFQFFNLIPTLTARENVLVSTEISDDPMDAGEALALVELSERSDHFPSQMSGGEQQRVAIARAVAKNPELLLCDEPTGSLDFRTGKRILSLLSELHANLRKTVLLITHNVAIAEMAQRVVRLRSGEIVEVTVNQAPASPEEITW